MATDANSSGCQANVAARESGFPLVVEDVDATERLGDHRAKVHDAAGQSGFFQ